MSGKKTGPKGLAPPGEDDFIGLSLEILQCANKATSRPEFLREVLHILCKISNRDYAAILMGAPGRPGYCYAELRFGRYSYRQSGMAEGDSAAGESVEAPEKIVRLPLVYSGDKRGRLELGGPAPARRDKKETVRPAGLAQTVGLALTNWDAQSALRERVKELSCLYGIARLVEPPDKPLDEILLGAASLLPRAWLHAESARSCIRLGDREFQTPGYESGVQRQSADILVNGEKCGSVTVVYTEEKPQLDEGPFLYEERILLDNVALQLSRVVERHRHKEERKEILERLGKANRLALVGQLSASIAHEINEPLTTILGYAELAAKSPGLPEQARVDISKVVSTSLHARDVVRKILMFARMMPQKETAVDLEEIIRDVSGLLESRRVGEDVEMVVEIAAGADKAFGDPARYRQLVSNLAINALQAMSGGGRLTIKTSREGDMVALEVADTGVGMSAEVLDKIFIPFYTTKGPGQGTGLGLSVAHDIVSDANGTIEVDSAPGRGTLVRVTLPAGRPASDGKEG